MGAFDWSPGGCCCVKPSWFDILAFQPNYVVPVHDFERTAGMFPLGVVKPYASKTPINWFIPTSANDGSLAGSDGITRDGQIVWSIDYMVSGANLFQRLSCYNAVSKTQTCTVRDNQMAAVLQANTLSPHGSICVGNSI